MSKAPWAGALGLPTSSPGSCGEKTPRETSYGGLRPVTCQTFFSCPRLLPGEPRRKDAARGKLRGSTARNLPKNDFRSPRPRRRDAARGKLRGPTARNLPKNDFGSLSGPLPGQPRRNGTARGKLRGSTARNLPKNLPKNDFGSLSGPLPGQPRRNGRERQVTGVYGP